MVIYPGNPNGSQGIQNKHIIWLWQQKAKTTLPETNIAH